MDVYKYTIPTGYVPGSKPIDPCKKGAVNPVNTDQDCNCPPYVMGTQPDGSYGLLETNFTGLFDPDRLSGLTYDTSNPNNTIVIPNEPISPLGGYQFGDVVLADHDAMSPYNPRAGCLNQQGPHCFVYVQEDYNITGFDYFTTPEGPAPWKSPIYPLDDPFYQPGIGIVGVSSGYAGLGSGGGSYQGGPWVCCDSQEIIDITAFKGPNHQIPVFLDQDFNDIGFYTPFDGGIFQKDLFSNFITVVESGTTDTINLTNSTPFGLYSYTQGFAFTVDWGDGTSTNVMYPTIELTHQYTLTGNFTISIQMVAPWGITSVSQPITIPYYSGSSLTVPNPNLSFTYTSPAGNSTTQNWMYSDFGPLDSGTNVFDYVTSNYAPVPITVTGITDSQLSNFVTYNTSTPSNSPFLPNGYFLNQLIPLGGEVQVGIGDFQNTLYGEIISASATFTAYTISDGGSMNNPVQMFDYDNGITIFEVDTVGLNQYNLFTQSCDPLSLNDLDEDPDICEFCLDTQLAITDYGQFNVNVISNEGMWDPGSSYQPGDLVRWAGCCWFAGVTIPPPIGVPPNDPQVFEGGPTSPPVGWFPCPGQNCEATTAFDPADIFGCTDSTALNFDPLATIDDGSCVYDGLSGTGTITPDNPVDNDPVGFTGSTTTTGSTAVGTSSECCDDAALNYAGSPPCGDPNVISDNSLCNYLGNAGEVWVCDPQNALRLRCVSDVDASSNLPTGALPPWQIGNPDSHGCSAVEHPNSFSSTLVVNAPVNCNNSVATPDSTEIDIVQNGGFINGISVIGLDSGDTWGLDIANGGYPNTNGGRGTGCVQIDRAWHPADSNPVTPPQGGQNPFSNGPTNYGCPGSSTYCYDWEYATTAAADNLISLGSWNSLADFQWVNVGFVGAYPPGIVGRDMNGDPVQPSNNKINPVVELINVYTSFGVQETFNTYYDCMSQNLGCPSTVVNLKY